MSPQEDRPSYRVNICWITDMMWFRCDQTAGEIFGRTVVFLQEIGRPVDIVDVFRRSEDCEAIFRDAVAIGAKHFVASGRCCECWRWKIATDAGLLFVMDTCIKNAYQVHWRMNQINVKCNVFVRLGRETWDGFWNQLDSFFSESTAKIIRRGGRLAYFCYFPFWIQWFCPWIFYRITFRFPSDRWVTGMWSALEPYTSSLLIGNKFTPNLIIA